MNASTIACQKVKSSLFLGFSAGGNNPFVSCLPSALNFGVSSMLLKASACDADIKTAGRKDSARIPLGRQCHRLRLLFV